MCSASSAKTSATTSGTAKWNGLAASAAWKKVSGFSATPRITGASGVRPRDRWASTSASRTSARSTSGLNRSIVFSSWLVRKPSKKWTNGTRVRRVAAWATSAKSCASCTEEAESIAQPVIRALITSEWSPKILNACVATVRAATWITAGVSSPAILYMLGSINNSPWDAVKVVPSVPFVTAPCSAPAAPASDCSSTTSGTPPQRFFRPAADHASADSPIAEDGVIG